MVEAVRRFRRERHRFIRRFFDNERDFEFCSIRHPARFDDFIAGNDFQIFLRAARRARQCFAVICNLVCPNLVADNVSALPATDFYKNLKIHIAFVADCEYNFDSRDSCV